MEPYVLSLLSALLVSLISLAGIFFVLARLPVRFTFQVVSFAVGALLGDAFIHLLPQSFASLDSTPAALLVIAGIIIFFSLEKFLKWRHCHEPDHHHHSHIASINLVGDSFHNLLDGILIASSYLVSIPLGLTTTLAVILHEIPQEIGDYGILIHQGFSYRKALLYNLLTAQFSLLGVVLTLAAGSLVTGFSLYLVPVTAGAFIYLSSSDLIPELHRHNPRASDSLVQICFISLGVLLMLALTFLE